MVRQFSKSGAGPSFLRPAPVINAWPVPRRKLRRRKDLAFRAMRFRLVFCGDPCNLPECSGAFRFQGPEWDIVSRPVFGGPYRPVGAILPNRRTFLTRVFCTKLRSLRHRGVLHESLQFATRSKPGRPASRKREVARGIIRLQIIVTHFLVSTQKTSPKTSHSETLLAKISEEKIGFSIRSVARPGSSTQLC